MENEWSMLVRGYAVRRCSSRGCVKWGESPPRSLSLASINFDSMEVSIKYDSFILLLVQIFACACFVEVKAYTTLGLLLCRDRRSSPPGVVCWPARLWAWSASSSRSSARGTALCSTPWRCRPPAGCRNSAPTSATGTVTGCPGLRASQMDFHAGQDCILGKEK